MHYSLSVEHGLCQVAVTGDIDSGVAALFADLAAAGGCLQVEFDCELITRINSAGIKTWLEGMRLLPDVATITFRRCPPVFLEVAAMVPAFLGSHQITSLYLGYVCENCEQEAVLLVHATALGPLLPAAPRCAGCGCALHPDDYAKDQLGIVFHAA